MMVFDMAYGSAAWQTNNSRLKNQIFKIIPTFEEKGDWIVQRDGVLKELNGFSKIFSGKEQTVLITVSGKLASITPEDDFNSVKKVVFRCLREMDSIKDEC